MVILARYGEIHLKGNNKGLFLRRLLANLQKRIDGKVKHEGERIIISDYKDEKSTLGRVTKTFGIVSASPAFVLSSTPDAITKYLETLIVPGTFKVNINRADKKFPIKSPEFAPQCGGIILNANPTATVNLHNPDSTINIDIRQGNTYIYTKVIEGVGGLPVGVSGRAIVLLSGGIDSPVAAWLAAKRGLSVDFIHFATPPYTSELALDKVRKLQEILEDSVGKSKLYVIPFTEISMAIRKHCSPEFMITLMRRFMVRIADRMQADCIITGENLAQVASQTIQGITSNNFCATRLPILRPLITYDKSEIISLAKKIGTYEISIVPHEDCCSVFVPRNPIIAPKLKQVLAEEEKLDAEILINKAMEYIS
ncbi:MAG: tRNA 4-thiouridine(8) synthase ThiI [Firmicutes bacterium]|nr:tRNA 4-thiouridine(8) synthase ThiI [Bacillota bacterium]